MDSIGERIVKARRFANMSQKELAQKSGITETSLSRYENNTREPKAHVLGQISDVLNVSCDYLIGITDDINYKRATLKGKTTKDVEDIITRASMDMSQEGLMFSGKPASKEAIDSVLKAMRMGLLLALEEQNKEK